MKMAEKEMKICESQLFDDTKALQLEFCAISAMIGCNITNERLGESSMLQYDEDSLKLVGAYVLYLMFCQATGQDLEPEFALSPKARLLFDDVESKSNQFIFDDILMTKSETLIENQFLKVFKVSMFNFKLIFNNCVLSSL